MFPPDIYFSLFACVLPYHIFVQPGATDGGGVTFGILLGKIQQ